MKKYGKLTIAWFDNIDHLTRLHSEIMQALRKTRFRKVEEVQKQFTDAFIMTEPTMHIMVIKARSQDMKQ